MTLSSLLAVRDIPSGNPGRGAVLALHGRGGDLHQLEPLCRAVAPEMRLVLAEGPKTVMAYTVQTAANFEGYSWYPGERGHVFEPVRFGHALACLEELVEQLRPQGPVLVLGYDEGAVLALTLAAILPDILSGAAAIGGALPRVDGWEIPFRAMDGLPVLLVDAKDHDAADLAELQRRGATLVTREVQGVGEDPLQAADVVREWLGDVAG